MTGRACNGVIVLCLLSCLSSWPLRVFAEANVPVETRQQVDSNMPAVAAPVAEQEPPLQQADPGPTVTPELEERGIDPDTGGVFVTVPADTGEIDSRARDPGGESSAAGGTVSGAYTETGLDSAADPAADTSIDNAPGIGSDADAVQENTQETGKPPVAESPAAEVEDEYLPPVIRSKEAEFLKESDSLSDDPAGGGEFGYVESDREAKLQPLDDTVRPLSLLGKTVEPGKALRLHWVASETFYGSNLDTPVYVTRGEKPGLTLCLTAAVHGDELNGVEIVRRLMTDIAPEELSGTLIGVPIVNLLGFTRGTRYLPDRRDLNRYFPGNPIGSSASRIANSFFEEIIRHCDRLVDFHTGSLSRTNMPQIRANLQIPEILEFTQHFGSTAVLHSGKLRGNLRSAATNAGIPAIALELGEPGSLQNKQVKAGVTIIEILLSKLGMIKRSRGRSDPQPVYYSSRWVRVNNGGLLTTRVKVGARIRKGTVLGSIVNPLNNESYEVVSPYNGRLLGMALNQFMLPGYAAFNIGLVEDEPTTVVDAQTFECIGTDKQPDQIADVFSCTADESDEIERADFPSDTENGADEAEFH